MIDTCNKDVMTVFSLCKFTVSTLCDAMKIAFLLVGSNEICLDDEGSSNAGYDIYRFYKVPGVYICKLNSRIEVNFPDGSSKNIWIERMVGERRVEGEI